MRSPWASDADPRMIGELPDDERSGTADEANARRKSGVGSERPSLSSSEEVGTGERCSSCGSLDLFSGYFDAEGLAVSHNIGDEGVSLDAGLVHYETRCNSCGEVVR